ncbi:hypothetical protein [Massilibacteroides vaginae]|uniref:hypothetical protein n=1 Tax=Massilibacteroides vaginae TaxID=1673718 RepID=UPI000A1CEE44|nr:hypothetical protein [Massilibacteroides vaginae]
MKELFTRLPEKKLPDNFRADVMKTVMREAVRMKKREERFGLFITIAIATVMLALGTLALLYLKMPDLEFNIPDLSGVPFFIYIGCLVFLLLAIDYKCRKHFYEKRSKQHS